MKYFILFLFLSINQLTAQIENGSFENWYNINNSEVPENWDTYIYWDDYSSVIVKDTSAYDGNYSILLIGGTVYSEGDCLRQITGKFKSPDSITDSLIMNFAYKSVSRNSFGRTSFVLELNGKAIYRSTTEVSEYRYNTIKFENPKTDSLIVNIESHRLGSATDGCPDISDHWLDAMVISSSIDLDNDGFDTTTDCDDENPFVNPNQDEEPYNGIDDDCDIATLDDDLDEDGFLLVDDCDDENPFVNPNQVEEPYNGIDDDCDIATLDDDLDQDGFLLVDDCDDENPFVNPYQDEEPYNGIDDDCDIATLDDDLDEDGFLLVDDCDDDNPFVNPNQDEEPYNGIDDDCNALTLDDDLDQDGFLLVDDCEDSNANINSDAEEVPNNGIDEDCDGMDLLSSVHQLSDISVLIYPNPAIDFIYIEIDGILNYSTNLFDLSGRLIVTSANTETIDIKSLERGVYLLEIVDINTDNKIAERIVIEN